MCILTEFVYAATLTVHDHTKVMRFLLDHPKAFQHWLKSRGRSRKISPDVIFRFISNISTKTRSLSDIVSIVKRVKNFSYRARSIRHKGIYNDIITRIHNVRNIAELQSILVQMKNDINKIRTKNKMIANLSMGLEISSEIIQDGMANGIYSPKSYSRFIKVRNNRGVMNALWDKVTDIAKDDAIGAVIGMIAGPEGAIAGAINTSSVEVGETVLDLTTGGAEPAY